MNTPIGSVSQQRLHLLDALPQQPLGALALRQVLANLVLPLARAQRGAHRAHQRGDAHRPLEHRDVAEQVHRLRDALGIGAVPREHQDRQVRPRRLPGKVAPEAVRCGPASTSSSGTSSAPAPCCERRAQRVEVSAARRRRSRPGSRIVARERRVARGRREDQDAVARAHAASLTAALRGSRRLR